MNDEKEVEIQAKELAEKLVIVHTDYFKSPYGISAFRGQNLSEVLLPMITQALTSHGKAMFEKGQATGIRMLWELCSDFKLGAGGCPDGLIREYVTRLKERVAELELVQADLFRTNEELRAKIKLLKEKNPLTATWCCGHGKDIRECGCKPKK